jgi:hypothetical protein
MANQARDTLIEALKALRSNPDDPEAVIAGFEAQASKREQRVEKLQTEASALRGIADHMRSLLGEAGSTEKPPEETSAPVPPPESNGIRPEGMEAIRQIMKAGGVWTGGQLLDEMKRRGWESKESKNPIRPTEAALNRLWKVKKEVERVGRGQYRYIGPPGTHTGSTDNLALLNGEDHADRQRVEPPFTG